MLRSLTLNIYGGIVFIPSLHTFIRSFVRSFSHSPIIVILSIPFLLAWLGFCWLSFWAAFAVCSVCVNFSFVEHGNFFGIILLFARYVRYIHVHYIERRWWWRRRRVPIGMNMRVFVYRYKMQRERIKKKSVFELLCVLYCVVIWFLLSPRPKNYNTLMNDGLISPLFHSGYTYVCIPFFFSLFFFYNFRFRVVKRFI